MTYDFFEGTTHTHEAQDQGKNNLNFIDLLKDGNGRNNATYPWSPFLVDVSLDDQKSSQTSQSKDSSPQKPDAANVEQTTEQKTAQSSPDVSKTAEQPKAPAKVLNTPTFESWGRFGRKYAIDTTGNAAYEVKKGDTYAGVARDVLEKRNGRKYDFRDAQDKSEILKLSRELADVNGVKWGKHSIVMIRPGDVIRIPALKKPEVQTPVHNSAPAKPLQPTAQKEVEAKKNEVTQPKPPEKLMEPAVKAGSAMIQPHEQLYSLMQPPGFEGFPGQSWNKELGVPGKSYDIDNRTVTSSKQLSDGRTEHTYAGKIDTGLWKSNKFTAREVVDSEGRILEREMNYAKPLKIKLGAPGTDGVEMIVTSVELHFDRKTGTYTSRCATKDGHFFEGRLSADGRVLGRN